MTAHLRPLDLAIVAAYLVGITLFGLRFRKKSGGDKSLRSYFLADNTIPWWAIALSIVSAETSTLTIISIPGVAFAGNFGFLQIVLGYMLGRIVVAALFLPRYFSGNMMTAYQLIDRRFGSVLHKVTAGLFLLTRAAAEGVRVFAVSIVVGIAIGTRDVLSIGIISALTLLYTFEGGMAAVIWTDVVQMAIYVGGTVVAILTLGRHVPGGWATIHTVAGAAGKFHMFNFAFNLTTTYTFWAGILGGTFLTMASHGTDQLMVQRMLAARNLRESRLALLSSGVVIFIQFALFLLIGAGLFVFYGLHPKVFASSDRIFPTFIVREMPLGIAGLLVAAILAAAMSNLSAALNSLSSTTVVDFYMHLRPHADDRERTIISKSSTLLWALVLFAIAIATVSVGGKGHVVEIGLSIASVAYGCLLGVFLLGTLTKFATQRGATIGMLCGFVLNLWLWQGTFPKKFFPGDVLHCPPGTNNASDGYSWASCTTSGITIPHIAFTWYVLIGALVTFAIGSLFSLIFRKQSNRPVATSLLLLLPLSLPFWLSSRSEAGVPNGRSLPVGVGAQGPASLAAQEQKPAERTPGYPKASALGKAQVENGALAPEFASSFPASSAPDFTPITSLLNDAIAAHKLPGAVVLIGHNGSVVFEHAYGNRKLAGEPGLDGKTSPAEPMTEDTIFDMASLTKCLATATAVMQLSEQGKITSFDDSVEKYLPAFNPQHDETRAKVTLRMLLTHTSGEAPDVDLRDPWGLAAPDKAEGIHRALNTPLKAAPGSIMTYSDINFILLGDLVETLSGQREDDYAREHIFLPLGMVDTRYHPFDQALDPAVHTGAAIEYAPFTGNMGGPTKVWFPSADIPRTAPTAHDNEGTPTTNPNLDHLLRGTVHDPTTRRMGGVAGHAGVFSTAHDIGLFAQALLDKLTKDTGPFPLKQSTLQLMTQPEQPSTTGSTSFNSDLFTASQLRAANQAQAYAVADGDKAAAPGLAPSYPAMKGVNLRGFGWDIDTGFSKPRGAIFPIGSFGHTGFTGTSLWMDPASDTYVILLANAIHPRGNPPISNLRGQLATTAAQILGIGGDCPPHTICDGAVVADSNEITSTRITSTASIPNSRAQPASSTGPSQIASKYLEASASGFISPQKDLGLQPLGYALPDSGNTLTGIDVLEATHFAALHEAAQRHGGILRIGLVTNQSGLDAQGHRTIDILTHSLPEIHLTTLFSPEHGIAGKLDTETVASATDPTTHLPIVSLYGPKSSDRHPKASDLAKLDAVVIDLQDAGVRFWTYEALVGYFVEATNCSKLELIVLDRPNLIGGVAVQGPVSDYEEDSYVDYMSMPVRHGMTLGELARYFKTAPFSAEGSRSTQRDVQRLCPFSGPTEREPHPSAVPITVIPMQHWSRTQYFADTGLPWINPSPNLRSPEAAILYPALGLIETTNISVGRGTSHPFEFFGAGAPPVATPTGATHTVTASGYGAPQSHGNAGPPSISGQIKVTSEPARAAIGKPWFNADTVAAALTARRIPGVTFQATVLPIADDGNNYPYYGQAIPAVHVTVTDRTLLDTPELGIEILAVLHRLYPTQFQLPKVQRLLCNQATLDALTRGDDPRDIAANWQPALAAFRTATKPYLLYR